MNQKMTEHSVQIDEIENKLIHIFKKRKQRREGNFKTSPEKPVKLS